MQVYYSIFFIDTFDGKADLYSTISFKYKYLIILNGKLFRIIHYDDFDQNVWAQVKYIISIS